MRTEKQILELRGEVDKQQRDILARAAAEKRALTPDESLQWDKADQDFQALSRELDLVRNLAERDAVVTETREAIIEMTARGTGTKSEADLKKEQAERYWKQLLFGEGMTQEEARRMAADPTRAQTTTVTGNGAFLIPEEFIRMLEVTQKAFGGMFQAAYKHRSVRGGTMNWPTFDNTARTGEWLDEPRNTGLTPTAFTFNRKQFAAYLWADMAQLTWEFIQDEDVSFVSRHLAEAFGESSGRALNKAFTDGNGTGKPTGILDASGGAGVGKELASQTALTKVEVIDLIHSLDPAYRTGPNVAFMMHDSVLAVVRKLDFGTTDDEPVWQPSYQAGVPDRILGYNYVINQDFPSALVQSAKIIAFGDWNKYVIRQVQDFSMVRLNERFADQLSTGFLGWLRIDGKLLQSAAIKLMQCKTT
jgi:HK97 family phage major capsid protein